MLTCWQKAKNRAVSNHCLEERLAPLWPESQWGSGSWVTLSMWLNLSELLLVPHMQIRPREARTVLWPPLVGSHPPKATLPSSFGSIPAVGSGKGLLAVVPEPVQDPQGSRLFSRKVCSHPAILPSRQDLAREILVTGSNASPTHVGDILENPKLLERRGTWDSEP